MEKSFYLFDEDFNETSEFSSVIYIVIVDSDRALLDEELHCVWDERFIDELRNIDAEHIYYEWNDDEEVYDYIPYCDEDLISKLHDITESLRTPVEKMECTSEVGTKLAPHKFRLTFELVDGTTFTINRMSEDICDLYEIASLLSKELYFKGQIKSVHIE